MKIINLADFNKEIHYALGKYIGFEIRALNDYALFINEYDTQIVEIPISSFGYPKTQVKFEIGCCYLFKHHGNLRYSVIKCLGYKDFNVDQRAHVLYTLSNNENFFNLGYPK